MTARATVLTYLRTKHAQDKDLSDAAKALLADAFDAVPQGPAETDTAMGETPRDVQIESITVTAFRGIGSEATLTLPAGAGLTIVTGKNGAGKSSFADALEAALTGTVTRLEGRTGPWKRSWRNVHAAGNAPTVVVRMRSSNLGRFTLTATWPATPDRTDHVGAAKRTVTFADGFTVDVSQVGWDEAVAAANPMLPFDTVRTILENQVALYSAIRKMLGIEALADVTQALAEATSELATIEPALEKEVKAVRAQLKASADPRAAQALRLTHSWRTKDVNDLDVILEGETGDDPDQSALAALDAIRIPSEDDVENAATVLDAALAALDGVTGDGVVKEAVVDAALSYHEAHPDDVGCPVCRSDRFDAEAVARLRDDKERLVRENRAMRLAHSERRTAVETARRVVRDAPLALAGRVPDSVAAEVEGVRRAWASWARQIPDDAQLPQHLRGAWPALADAVNALKRRLQILRKERADEWKPLAVALGRVALMWHRWTDSAEERAAVGEATEWLARHDSILSSQQLGLISRETKKLWEALRHGSDVQILDLAITGTITSRARAAGLPLTLDGVETDLGAAVLSQGEANAVGLAVFLPRATMKSSPFGFIVLDDPVQAFDPAKVSTLVTELDRAARGNNRQIVVFSHDERVAAAARRLPSQPSFIKVRREQRGGDDRGPTVTTEDEEGSPADRYLAEARYLIRALDDPRNAERQATLRRILAKQLRSAVEAAAYDHYVDKVLAAPADLVEADRAWEATGSTRDRLILAYLGVERRGQSRPGDGHATANDRLARWQGDKTTRRSIVLNLAAAGSHGAIQQTSSPLLALVDLAADFIQIDLPDLASLGAP